MLHQKTRPYLVHWSKTDSVALNVNPAYGTPRLLSRLSHSTTRRQCTFQVQFALTRMLAVIFATETAGLVEVVGENLGHVIGVMSVAKYQLCAYCNMDVW